MGYITWTPQMEKDLKLLHESDLTFGQIASRMNISRDSVAGKVRRMGLSS